jgi:chaperonin cofactor prefoldin
MKGIVPLRHSSVEGERRGTFEGEHPVQINMKAVIPSLFLSAPLFLATTLAQGAELPVKEVVLYKHGVGFFERSGRLGAGESARLDFDATEMNDVLKSLTVEERGGGKISGLRYDSMDPLSHTLASFPFHIDAGQALSAVLDQLKGARIELQFGTEAVAGTIVSSRRIEASDKQPEREQLTLLLDNGDLRNVDLGAAGGIRLTDPRLQNQFKEYLGALAGARSKDKRSVYIDSTDTKERDVIASYMVPMPVWKSSYRLIFGSAKQPLLEGWAIVDNTTGEDWNKVQLSLVSGRPISFISELYAPRYVERPKAELPDDRAAAPVIHQGAFEQLAAAPAAGLQIAGNAGAGFGGGVFKAPPPPVKREERAAVPVNGRMLDGTPLTDAVALELGELFEYRMPNPVTIRKNESAMLPFLQQPIEARKLLIYSQRGSQHPTNATGKTLDGGPITVYDEGAYGGEALVETVKAGDKRLISYAVDLGTRVTEAFGGKAAIVREIHASRGILTSKLAAEETRTYTALNVDQKAKTLIIEHPVRFGYTLLNQKPTEKTANAYRFEVQLAPGATREFPVAEERVYDETYSVTNLTPDALLVYVRNRDLNAVARNQLQRIADQKSQIAETQSAASDVEKQIRDLTSDEDRIRRNIESLNSVSGQQQQVQNYARQLDTHEQQLASLRDRQADLQKKKSALEADLGKMIDGLSF